jgi:hypothetical protein
MSRTTSQRAEEDELHENSGATIWYESPDSGRTFSHTEAVEKAVHQSTQILFFGFQLVLF